MTGRKLIVREDERRLVRFKRRVRSNAGVLYIILVTTASVVTSMVITSRKILWNISDATRRVNREIKWLEDKREVKIPPVLEKLADGLEWLSDNVWVLLICAVGGMIYVYS